MERYFKNSLFILIISIFSTICKCQRLHPSRHLRISLLESLPRIMLLHKECHRSTLVTFSLYSLVVAGHGKPGMAVCDFSRNRFRFPRAALLTFPSVFILRAIAYFQESSFAYDASIKGTPSFFLVQSLPADLPYLHKKKKKKE